MKKPFVRTRMSVKGPQPTESEAIVAALRAPKDPGTPLVPPVPLPVDKAAALPVEEAAEPAADKPAEKPLTVDVGANVALTLASTVGVAK